MECPQCSAAMLRGQKSWVCENCGQRVPFVTVAPLEPLAGIARLPSLLAIPLQEYRAEGHAVMRLHRLCDAAEHFTRFCAIVTLAELRRRCGAAPLPEMVLRELRPQIERPTFGKWRSILETLVKTTTGDAALVVPELPDFINRQLLPQLAGGDNQPPETCLVTLRNLLVHGGAMTRGQAEYYLNGTVAPPFAGWQAWLAILTQQLTFLADADVCHFSGGIARRLAGPTADLGEELPLSVEARGLLSERGLEDHVLLLRRQQWLDLWPFCEFGRASAVNSTGRRQSDASSPLLYLRAQRDRLVYVALGVDLPHGERTENLAQFRSLFQLTEGAETASTSATDYEVEIRHDAAALVGRLPEIAHVKKVLKPAQGGVFWVSGPGGIGKSYLLARLAHDLQGDGRKTCRIAWRFHASDLNRGNRVAFFRHAVARLAAWLNQPQLTPERDADSLWKQLMQLLDEAAHRPTPEPPARPPRVLFVLDGLDEIARLDPDFPRVPFQLQRDNVVWLCAGRAEGTLPAIFAADRCTHLFPGGLPAISDADVRGMLLDETGALKYELLRLDVEGAASPEASAPAVYNAAVQAIVRRAAGLPLYVRHVIQDLVAGDFHVDELERRLPHGLNAYYDNLLRRLAIGELQALLTPLLVTLAWALAPLDEETLLLLLVRRKVLQQGDDYDRALLCRGLEALGSMIHSAAAPSGGHGYEPYHLSFREHIQSDAAGLIGRENTKARDALCSLALDWVSIPRSHAARHYVLRHGPRTLFDAGRREDVIRLLNDIFFLEAKAEAGLVFDLAADFAVVLRALPPDHPLERTLRLLEEALRRELHLLAQHPTALFQCMWNLAWWYDAPEAAFHFDPPATGWPPEGAPWQRSGTRLYSLLETWRQAKERAQPGYAWLRALRPPSLPLGATQRVFRGHEGDVFQVAFTPDGHRLGSAGGDKSVRVWDADSGQELACLRGHESAVLSLAFAPDGRRIASGGADKTVRMWDADSGQELACLRGHTGEVTSVVFAREGRLASASKDGTLRVWDADSGHERACLHGHEGEVSSVAYAPDGRLASGGKDGTARIWDVDNGRELACLRGEDHTVRAVAFSPDGRRLACGGSYGTLRLWDWAAGPEPPYLQGHGGDVTGVAFSADGRFLASASSDKSVRLWDAATGRELACIRRHEHSVRSVAFSPDGRRLASAGADGTVRLGDAHSAQATGSLRGHVGEVTSLAFSPDGRCLASGAADARIRLWDTDNGRCLFWLRGHQGVVTSVAFAPDGQRLASGSWDETVRLWDTGTGAELVCLRGHQKWLTCVAFSPDGRRLVSTAGDETLRQWDAISGDQLACFRTPAGSVRSVDFSPDGSRLALGCYDKTVRLWDAASGQELACFHGLSASIRNVAFSPDGRRLFAAAKDGTSRQYDVDSGDCLGIIQGNGDLSALAAGISRFPWRAQRRPLETEIVAASTGEALTWFPLPLKQLTTHPSGRAWAGAFDNVVYIFRLDSGPQGVDTPTIT